MIPKDPFGLVLRERDFQEAILYDMGRWDVLIINPTRNREGSGFLGDVKRIHLEMSSRAHTHTHTHFFEQGVFS